MTPFSGDPRTTLSGTSPEDRVRHKAWAQGSPVGGGGSTIPGQSVEATFEEIFAHPC